MNRRRVTQIVLAIFIVASIGYMLVKQINGQPASEYNSAIQIPDVEAKAKESHPDTPSKSAGDHKIIAYYFHGIARCPSCRKIEAYTEKAVKSGFDEEIKARRLEWRVVNVDQPENSHYIKDYQLYTKSVVIVDMQGEKQARWKNLEKVWELLNDEGAFISYITNEVTAYMEAK